METFDVEERALGLCVVDVVHEIDNCVILT